VIFEDEQWFHVTGDSYTCRSRLQPSVPLYKNSSSSSSSSCNTVKTVILSVQLFMETVLITERLEFPNLIILFVGLCTGQW